MEVKSDNEIQEGEPFLNQPINSENINNNLISKEKERKVLIICLSTAIVIIIIGAILSINAANNNNNIKNDLSNALILKYYNSDIKEYKLFDSSNNNVFDYIQSIKIDNKRINYLEKDKYKFPNIGEHSVIIKFHKNITSLNMLFKNCDSLTNVDFSYFNSENIMNLSELFSGCSSLTSINFTNFDTSNVYNMSYMFFNCSKLNRLDLHSFNMTNTKDTSGMFKDCKNLEFLNISNYDTTTELLYMNSMFYNCVRLTSLDLKNFNTINVINMSYLFYNCKSLMYLDISKFYYNITNGYNNMFTNIAYKGQIIYSSNKFLIPLKEFEDWEKKDLAFIDY